MIEKTKPRCNSLLKNNAKRKYLNLYGLIFILALIFISCGEKPIYSEDKSFGESWFFSDSVHFNLPAPDTSLAYAMKLNISHTKEYPFQNIYLRISTAYPSGRNVQSLLNIDLATKSGSWYGDCAGDKCVLAAPLRDDFYFSESGEYKITMEQFTRADPLIGLTGLELELYSKVE